MTGNIWNLWPHQEEAVAQIEKAWHDGTRAICYQCPTGAGKTRILRTIVDNHSRSKKVIYIIAHRRNLVKQLSEEISEAGIPHGIIAADSPMLRYRVQVASLQTIGNEKRLSRIPEPEMIVIDECHHAKSPTYMRLLNRWPRAMILGVSATPQRLDNKPMSDIFQLLILGPTMRELIEAGFLADYEYYAPAIVAAPEHIRAGEYSLDEVAAIMDKKTIIGDVIEHYKRHAERLPAIASCASIAHAEHVARAFCDAGYRAQAVHSGMEQRAIESAMNALRDGSLNILTQCELLGEGIDIPGATVLIGLRHTASLTIYLQHIGRVLRRFNGKKKAIILDHVGNYTRHGLPDDPREWSLDGNPPRDDTRMPKRCPECFHIVGISKRVCPYCGFQWTETADSVRRAMPEQEEGDLVQVERRPTVTMPWKELIEEIRARARDLKEAIAIGKQYGYRHTAGWTVWKNILKKY